MENSNEGFALGLPLGKLMRYSPLLGPERSTDFAFASMTEYVSGIMLAVRAENPNPSFSKSGVATST